jgi:hypothetical protein
VSSSERPGKKQARRLKGIIELGKAKAEAPVTLKAEHHGGGKFNVTKGEEVLLSGFSKADADAFNAMSETDKAEYVEANKK